MSRVPIDHFPLRIRPFFYRLCGWPISDAPVYVGCAAIAVAYAVVYSPIVASFSQRIHPLAALTPYDFWAMIWALAGGGLIVSAVWERYRLSTISLSLWSALMMLRGVQYISTWALGERERGPAVGVVHIICSLVVSLAIWRGFRAEFTIKEV